MSNRKKFSEEEIKHIGLRIRGCRVLTGLTQEEFGNTHGFPVPSLKTWEFGTVIPRSEGLKKYCDSLRSFGLFVSPDWILYGTGMGPSYHLDEPDDITTVFEHPVSAEMKAIKEIFEDNRRKNRENPIVFGIDDDEMAPYFFPGDMVAGVLVDKDKFRNDVNKPVLVKLNNGKFAPRFLHVVDGEFFICSLKNPTIKKIRLDAIGSIKWHYSY